MNETGDNNYWISWTEQLDHCLAPVITNSGLYDTMYAKLEWMNEDYAQHKQENGEDTEFTTIY